MELLLSLIEKRKLFINKISLAQVTDDYLSYVKGLSHFPLGNIANFIIVATTLFPRDMNRIDKLLSESIDE